MKNFLTFMLIGMCTIICIQAHDVKPNLAKQTAPIPIHSPTAACNNQPRFSFPGFVTPSTSPVSSCASAPSHFSQASLAFSPLTPSTQFVFPSTSPDSLSCSPQSSASAQPLLARSVSVSPTSTYPATPSSSSPLAYEYMPFTDSSSATPFAPDQQQPFFARSNSTYGHSFSAAASTYMPSAEEIAAHKIADFKQFLLQYSDANRARHVTPLLEALNCDACLSIAKVAAERGTKNADGSKRNLYNIQTASGSLAQPTKNAQLALAALQAALPSEKKKK